MQKIALFIHEPVLPDVEKALDELRSGEHFNVQLTPINPQTFPMLWKARPCVVLVPLYAGKAALTQRLLKDLQQLRLDRGGELRDPSFRIVIVSEKNETSQVNWASLGVYEMMMGVPNPQVLSFKLERHYQKAITAGKRIEAEPDAPEAKRPTYFTHREWNILYQPKSSQPKPFLYSNHSSHKIKVPISISVRIKELEGRKGNWNRKESAKGPCWEWADEFENLRSLAFKSNKIRFYGENPSFNPIEQSWNLDGLSPKLVSIDEKSQTEEVLIEGFAEAGGVPTLSVKPEVKVCSVKIKDLHSPEVPSKKTETKYLKVEDLFKVPTLLKADEAEVTLLTPHFAMAETGTDRRRSVNLNVAQPFQVAPVVVANKDNLSVVQSNLARAIDPITETASNPALATLTEIPRFVARENQAISVDAENANDQEALASSNAEINPGASLTEANQDFETAMPESIQSDSFELTPPDIRSERESNHTDLAQIENGKPRQTPNENVKSSGAVKATDTPHLTLQAKSVSAPLKELKSHDSKDQKQNLRVSTSSIDSKELITSSSPEQNAKTLTLQSEQLESSEQGFRDHHAQGGEGKFQNRITNEKDPNSWSVIYEDDEMSPRVKTDTEENANGVQVKPKNARQAPPSLNRPALAPLSPNRLKKETKESLLAQILRFILDLFK